MIEKFLSLISTFTLCNISDNCLWGAGADWFRGEFSRKFMELLEKLGVTPEQLSASFRYDEHRESWDCLVRGDRSVWRGIFYGEAPCLSSRDICLALMDHLGPKAATLEKLLS